MKKCIVHLGPFKTASTSFQYLLASKSKNLADFNVFVPEIIMPGGHDVWLNMVESNLNLISQINSNLIISSEIISSYSDEKLLNFFKLLNSFGFIVYPIIVERDILDVFLSFNKDQIRHNNDPYLYFSEFIDFNDNSAYSSKILIEKINNLKINNLKIIKYKKTVVQDIWSHCMSVLKLVDENLINSNVHETIEINKSNEIGIEWFIYILKKISVNDELDKNVVNQIIEKLNNYKFKSDFLKLKIIVEYTKE